MENTQTLGSRLSPAEQNVAPASTQWWLAKGISLITSPPLLGVLSLALLGQQLNTPQDWGWLLLFCLLNIAAPVAYIVHLLRRGELSDFHMRNRSERIKPMRMIPLFLLLSWLIFQTSGAPVLYQAMALVGALQAVAMLFITLRWKISGHSAGAAAFSVLLWGLYGVVAAPVLLILPLVIWARVTLKRHDMSQSLAGALLGGATVLAIFLWAGGHCLGSGQLFCSIP